MRLRSFCPKCIIGADEEGIDLRHAIEDDVGAAAEKDSAVALVSDGTDDPPLLDVELIVGRHAVKRCIAEIAETVLADIVGAADDLLERIAGTDLFRCHGDDFAIVALDAHFVCEDARELSASAAVLTADGDD